MKTDARVDTVIRAYPADAQKQLRQLRELIITIAKSLGKHEQLDETLKWGEPAYLVPSGTAVRMDWKADTPEHIKLLFHCQTKLIDTFRQVYPDLNYEGNRAILLPITFALPDELTHCIELALTYHDVKHLPLLGID